MKIRSAKSIRGRLRVPGDKSISHRAALIGSLADGTSNISNYSTSADCTSTLSCLHELGISITRNGAEIQIEGRGASGLSKPSIALDCGNSGSTMRMLSGILAGQAFDSELTGDESLRGRPMKRLIEPLTLMGARLTANEGYPPLHISGSSSLKAIRYELPVASAQVKSCILFAGLNASGRTEIVETHGATRDHTERMLSWMGVPLQTDAIQKTVALDGPARYAAKDISIPGDVSSASFLIAAAAMLPDSDLTIEDIGLNPTRAQLVPFLRSVGCAIEIENEREVCNEPVGSVRVRWRQFDPSISRRNQIRGELVAQLIDELPLLAVVGSQISGGLEIRDATELRFKETDRIAATVANLRAMGAEVDEFEDGLYVTGPTTLRGGQLRAFGDHRIAMAFTIAALIADGDSELDDARCVGISFPEFFELLESVLER